MSLLLWDRPQGRWKKASVDCEPAFLGVVGGEFYCVWLKLVGAVLCCAALPVRTGVATERAQFMDLVRQQVSQLQETHGTDSPTLTFTGGSLQAVRPEELSDVVSAQ